MRCIRREDALAKFVADSDWADFLPVDDEPLRSRHLPAHEDCTPLEVTATAGHLRVRGTLGRMPGYEERPGQIDMASAIAGAFNARGHLMVEAGTGVGKSLAYLVPSILWASTNDTPVVISTATRNLQSQLIGSDIPRALGVLPEAARANFKVALLKGRGNYLCLKSVDDFFSAGYWTMSDDDRRLLAILYEFLHATAEGDLDGQETEFRQRFSRPGDECLGRHCPFRNRCFIYKARHRAAAAHLIVVNHSLVLSDVAAGSAAILPAYGRLIFDEAHNLEDIATDQFSVEFSMPALTHVIKRLLRHYKEASHRVAPVLGAAEELLDYCGRLLTAKTDVKRYQQNGLYFENVPRLRELQAAFERPAMELVNFLRDYADTLEDSEQLVRIEQTASQLLAIVNAQAFVVAGEKDTHAYWVERVRTDRRRSHLRLVAAPLSVAKELAQFFYDLKDSVILCSATLRVGSSFRYLAGRLGYDATLLPEAAPERFQMLAVESPFDYFRQTGVYAADYLPDPSMDSAGYAAALAGLLAGLFPVTGGRALVLFTSYEMMNAVAAGVRPQLAEAGIELLVQGEGLSRETMARRLKEAIDAGDRVVLFGAQSFWEGVDVAGEALSCVVIARLPFAQVKDPILEARSEQIERGGGSPFRDYALPEAVIRFRQGFGRLIRARRDRGVVVITDPRLVTKNYGAIFRRSIAATVHTVSDGVGLFDRVSEFVGSGE